MMTPLQIVLAIVGVSLIAAIVIYNLLQERRFRKEAEKMFSHQRENVVLGDSIIIDPTPVHTDKQRKYNALRRNESIKYEKIAINTRKK